MLTPSASWSTDIRMNPSGPRFVLEIYDGTNTWRATSGRFDNFDYNEGSVLSVASFSEEIDPLTRKAQVSAVDVDVLWNWIRPIMVNNIVKGQKATLKFGGQSTAYADLLVYFTGIIDEVLPEDGRSVKLTIMNLFEMLEKRKVIGYWFNVHPLEILYKGDGSGILEKAGVPTALIDTTSFDPTDAAYSTISHWCISRTFGNDGKNFDLYPAISALDAFDQIGQLLNGQRIVNEAGQLSFLRFDASAASVADLTEDDIIPGSFKQENLFSNMFNRISVEYHPNDPGGSESGGGDFGMTFVLNNPTSQSDFAYPGESTRISEHKFSSMWLNTHAESIALMTSDYDIDDTDTDFYAFAPSHQMCGNRAGYPPGSQPASAQLSAARPAYILIYMVNGPKAGAHEIVKAEGLTLSGRRDLEIIDPQGGAHSWISYSSILHYTSVTRAQFGTTAMDFHSSLLFGGINYDNVYWVFFDVTIQAYIAQALLDRFSYGCDVIEFKTGLHWFPIQRGDLITLDWPYYLNYGIDGLNNSVKWEVISKEPDPFSDPPSITWRVAAVDLASYTPTTTGYIGPRIQQQDHTAKQAFDAQDIVNPYAVLGGAFTAGAGLVGTVGRVVSSSYPGRVDSRVNREVTFTASTDTYVSHDAMTGELVFREVANGAAAPTIPYSEVQLTKVVTDGAGITGSTDLRATTAIAGSKLTAGTGPLTYLAQAGAFDNITHVTSRSLDDVSDGSTYKKVTGVDGTLHQVQAASIKDASVGVVHTPLATAAAFANLDLSQWTRG